MNGPELVVLTGDDSVNDDVFVGDAVTDKIKAALEKGISVFSPQAPGVEKKPSPNPLILAGAVIAGAVIFSYILKKG